MRRFMCGALLAALLLPAGASASSGHRVAAKGRPAGHPWLTFSSKKFLFSFKYPSDWQLTQAYSPQAKDLYLIHQGRNLYSMSVQILPQRADATVRASVRTLIGQQKAQGNAAFTRIQWSPTTIGGQPAMVGVSRPSTEGGVTLSAGIYIVNWRSRVNEIIIQSNHRPALQRLSQFPSVYQQILRTWRFL